MHDSQVLRPYHGWLLRKTFDLMGSRAPSREKVYRNLAPGVAEHERDALVTAEIRAFVTAAQPMVHILHDLFVRRQLEDLRKV